MGESAKSRFRRLSVSPFPRFDPSLDPANLCQPHQIGDSLYLHFRHDAGAMHFDCRFSNAQVTGNLFIQLAGDDMFEHFPLARCEGVETGADFGKPGLFSTDDSISFDGCANGWKEIFLPDWFREEIKRAMFHRLHTLRNVAVTGEKNNRQRTAFHTECCLKLKAIDVGHREIKHETSRHVWIVLGKKFPR